MGSLFGDTPTVTAPEKRDYLNEMRSALNAQSGVQNQLLDLEKQYTPQYQALQQQSLIGQLGVLGNLYGSAIPQSEALQSQMLASQGKVYAGLGQQSLNAYRGGLDASTMGLYNTMQQQAQAGLDAGYGLTPEMQRQAQQSARAAMTARGLAGGGQGVAQEVLNSYNLGQNRYQTALANAQQAYGLGTNQTANAYQMYGQPLMNQLGGVNASGLISNAGTMYGGLGARLFQPESQYNANLITANQSNEMQAQMANAQIQASKNAANMGLLGAVASAGLGAVGMAGGFGALGTGLKEFGGQYLGLNTWSENGGGWINGTRYSGGDS